VRFVSRAVRQRGQDSPSQSVIAVSSVSLDKWRNGRGRIKNGDGKKSLASAWINANQEKEKMPLPSHAAKSFLPRNRATG